MTERVEAGDEDIKLELNLTASARSDLKARFGSLDLHDFFASNMEEIRSVLEAECRRIDTCEGTDKCRHYIADRDFVEVLTDLILDESPDVIRDWVMSRM